MDISVILATYNRNTILTRTLDSFCNLNVKGITWEVIVVDNANDDDVSALVKSYTGRLPVLYVPEERKGKNYALNTAIGIAKGELYVFTDDDVIADSNWLMEMWGGARRWPEYSVFGGRILPDFPSGNIPISDKHPFFNGAYVVADWNIAEGPYEAHRVWGPNMAIRANLFAEGRRFNTGIGPCGKDYISGSETEFTIRVEREGYRSIFLPQSLVYHQIRPEQLEVRWLYGRAYRLGRSHAKIGEKPNVPFLFNAPRYLVRSFVEAAAMRIINFFNTSARIDAGIDFWMVKGEIDQYRNDSGPRGAHTR